MALTIYSDGRANWNGAEWRLATAQGTFDSPLHLPLWLNFGLGLGALAASTERALRLSNSWLDGAGN